jgi:DNA-binding NarL/FixJ family response regulator
MRGEAQRTGRGKRRTSKAAPHANGAASYRIVLGDRRISAHQELSARLTRSGHEVVACVVSLRAALELAERLKPDAVLFSPHLEDGLGVAAAMACTGAHPGIAAVVLTPHPGATDPESRPNWGPVSLAPIAATPEELDAILRSTIARARDATQRAPSARDGAAPRESE